MTTSILNDCLLLRNEPVERLQEYLSKINLTIFDEIIDNHKDEAMQMVLYILCAYSEDSPLVILRRDTTIEQEGICEYLNIPEFKRKSLIELKNKLVRNAVTAYITQFAGEMFCNLMFMKVQLRDYELAITNKEYYTTKETKDESGNVKLEEIKFLFDWKEQGKAQTQCNILSGKITALEKELKGQQIYRSIMDLKEYKFKNIEKKIVAAKESICIESSVHIKTGSHG